MSHDEVVTVRVCNYSMNGSRGFVFDVLRGNDWGGPKVVCGIVKRSSSVVI